MMLKFKENIELNQTDLSNRILSTYNDFVQDVKSFDKFEDFLTAVFDATGKAGKEKLDLVHDVIEDISEFNMESFENAQLYTLEDYLDSFENRIATNLINQENAMELPLSAYEYKGNSVTKFKKSLKLHSMFYQLF